MSQLSTKGYSSTGQRAVPDPIADVFYRTAIAGAAYTLRTRQSFISMAAGSPDPDLLPITLYQRLLVEALTTSGGSVLNYTSPRGTPSLADAFELHLRRQGVVCTRDTLLVTSGGMEALSLAAWMVLDPGDTVVTEGPGFAGALSAFKLYGANVVQLPCGEGGVLPTMLDEAIKRYRPKLVSLMPDYQNPTGALMPVSHRKQIVDCLKLHGVYALEDGAYSHLCLDGRGPLAPLQSFAPDLVFYATSVSKLLAPAMRIGGLVTPRAFTEKAAAIKSTFNMQASAIHQEVTACFLDEHRDHMASQLKVLQNTYRARRDAIVSALDAHFSRDNGFSWNVPCGGMFLWLEGPSSLNFSELFEKALNNGVAYIPGSKFYLPGPEQRHNAARLNFASISEQSIWEGIRRLAATVASD